MANISELKKYKHIHMIGIGGVSMSGIAQIMKHWGFTVTGSDWAESEVTRKLNLDGIHVVIGHDVNMAAKADVIVYTAAIKQDDPELVKARELGIETIERADFLGKITKAFTDTICISGTHGKTTTTSMVSMCFIEGLKDPSIQVGATLKAIDGNYRIGNSEHFIIEACEYVESFLKFYPKAEIILNIDNDHLDYFKNIENINRAFIKYVGLLPEDGLLVVNIDNKYCAELHKYTNAKVVSYGIENEKANFIARNIKFGKNGFPYFDVYYNNSFYASFQLSVPGKHNVLNALACIALCHNYGIEKENMKTALKKYTGAHRRFEYVGTCKGATVYDDYGHHPTEITATALGLKQKEYNKSWVVFQPHTYSRTKEHINEFANSLINFDNIIITDIYAARETNTYGVTSENIVEKIRELGREAVYIPKFEDIVKYLEEKIEKDDIILTLGAGTVTNIGPMLVRN
ncbi:MAG: UDP-N-acetylmuramate--L-alanine ligase [Clostridia bacterium]|nr:UDP-N-acetylmuramate--L-alanine ligase [Clostridia bacterium]